jgi:rod shape-determining protein MreB
VGAFDFFHRWLSRDLGIDLGTANTLVAVQGSTELISEPSVVAIHKDTNRILHSNGVPAVGDRAKAMLGRTPKEIQAIRPMKDGVIADFDIAEVMLRYFIARAHHGNKLGWYRPRIVVAVPSGITGVEKRAVKNSALSAGARAVFLIDEPLAAAIGAGLPVGEPVGSMIVDIGGGTTEVAVISMAGLVAAESLRIGGDALDEEIQLAVRRSHHLIIGPNMAEMVKFQIGSAVPLENDPIMTVRGRDARSGLPREIELSNHEVVHALQDKLEAIVNCVHIVLERTEPELAADLLQNGLTLAGGGSHLQGLDVMIQERTGLPVSIAKDPMTCVALGCALVLENIDGMMDILEPADN